MPTQRCLAPLTSAKNLVQVQQSRKTHNLSKMKMSRAKASQVPSYNMNKTWDNSMPIIFAAVSSSGAKSTWDPSHPVIFASGSNPQLQEKPMEKTWNSSRPILFSTNSLSVCRKCKESVPGLQRASIPLVQKRHRSTAKANKHSRMQQMILEADTELATETEEERAYREAKALYEAQLEKSKNLRTRRDKLLESWQQDFREWCNVMIMTSTRFLQSLQSDHHSSDLELATLKKQLALRKRQLDLIRKLNQEIISIDLNVQSFKVEFLRIPGIVRHQYALHVICLVLSSLVSRKLNHGEELIRIVEFHSQPELREKTFETIIGASTELDQMLEETKQLTIALRDAYEDYQLETRKEEVLKGNKSWGSLKRMVDRSYSKEISREIVEDISKLILLYKSQGRYERRRPYRQHERYMNLNMPALIYQWQLRSLTMATDAFNVETSWHYYGIFRRNLQGHTDEYDRYRIYSVSQLELQDSIDELVFLADNLRDLPQFPQLCSDSSRDEFRKSLFKVIARGAYLGGLANELARTMEEAWRVSTSRRFSLKNYQRLEVLRVAQNTVRFVFDPDEWDLLSKLGLKEAAQRMKPDMEVHFILHDLKQSLRLKQSRTDVPADPESIQIGFKHVFQEFRKRLDTRRNWITAFCFRLRIQLPNDLFELSEKTLNINHEVSHKLPSKVKAPFAKIDTQNSEPFGKGGYQISNAIQSSSLISSTSPDSEETTVNYSHTLYRNPNGQAVTVHYCVTKGQCESVAKHFLNEGVIGLDLEWKPSAKASDSMTDNVSLIQVSSESRIALFHVAICSGETPEEIIAPSLRQLIESPHIIKSGVGIAADGTRLAGYLKLQPRGLFELSYLHNVLINRRISSGARSRQLYSLDKMVYDYLGYSMNKGKVRISNWQWKLNHQQCEYAAADAYASLHLYYELNRRCKTLVPNPDLSPAFVSAKLGPGMIPTNFDDEEQNWEDEEIITSSEASLSDLSDESQNEDEAANLPVSSPLESESGLGKRAGLNAKSKSDTPEVYVTAYMIPFARTSKLFRRNIKQEIVGVHENEEWEDVDEENDEEEDDDDDGYKTSA